MKTFGEHFERMSFIKNVTKRLEIESDSHSEYTFDRDGGEYELVNVYRKEDEEYWVSINWGFYGGVSFEIDDYLLISEFTHINQDDYKLLENMLIDVFINWNGEKWKMIRDSYAGSGSEHVLILAGVIGQKWIDRLIEIKYDTEEEQHINFIFDNGVIITVDNPFSEVIVHYPNDETLEHELYNSHFRSEFHNQSWQFLELPILT